MNIQSGILKMFARSPIHPLQQHMEKAATCTELLNPFFTAVLNSNWDEAEKILNKIGIAEHEADLLKIDFRTNLPKDLFLPVPRTDLLSLLSKQELIANTAKDIAGLMFGRKMQIPPQLALRFQDFLQRSLDATSQAKKAISELDELLESGFRGKEVELVENMIKKLNKIEHETDEIQIKLRQDLFDIEKELPPIEVMFLYKIIEYIGTLADCAQETGGRLRMLIAG